MQSGSGPGQAGDLPSSGRAAIAAPLGKRLVIRVAVAAMKQDHVAGAKRPVLFLPGDDPLLLDQRALAGGSAIAQVAAIDDARLAAELPRGNDVRIGPPERARVGQRRLGRRDGVRRHVELRAGIAVNDHDVAVIRAQAGRSARNG